VCLPQCGSGIDPQLVAEPLDGLPVAGERVRGAAGAVQGEHELPDEPLAKRMRGDQLGQLGDEAFVVA
jgi:hypothetical protein